MKKVLLSTIALTAFLFSCTKETQSFETEHFTSEELQLMATRQASSSGDKYYVVAQDAPEGIGMHCSAESGYPCGSQNVLVKCNEEYVDIDCGLHLHEILSKVEFGDEYQDELVFADNIDFLKTFLPDKMVEGVIHGDVALDVFQLEERPEGKVYIEYSDMYTGDLIMASELIF